MKFKLLLILIIISIVFSTTTQWEFHTDVSSIFEIAVHEGQLFLGTPSGIASANPDGSNLVYYSAFDGFAGLEITRLTHDNSGILWYSSEDGYLGRYDNGSWQVFLDFARNNNGINDILAFEDDLLVATDRGLYRVTILDNFLVGEIDKVYRQIADLPDESLINDIHIFDDKLWIAYSSGVAFVPLSDDFSIPENWQSIHSDRSIVEMTTYQDEIVFAFDYDSELSSFAQLDELSAIVSVWGGESAARRVVDNMFVSGDTLWAMGSSSANNQVPSYHIPSMESFLRISNNLDVAGSYCATTFEDQTYFGLRYIGLGYFDDGTVMNQRLLGPTGSSFTKAVFQDDLTCVIAYDLGINWYEGQSWDKMTNVEQPFEGDIEDKMKSILMRATAINFDNTGRLWIASKGYGIAKGYLGTSDWLVFDTTNSDLSPAMGTSNFPVVSDIENDSLGNIWVVQNNPESNFPILVYRASELDGSAMMKIGAYYSPLNNINRVTCIDVGQKAWIGTEDGEVLGMDWHNNITDTLYYTWYFYNLDEIPGGAVQDLAIDSKGHVWVGTDNGLSRIEPEIDQVFEIFFPDNIMPVIRGIAIDKWDNVWLATSNGGVVISGYSGDMTIFRPLFQSDAYPEQRTPILSDNVLGVSINPENQDVWFLTASGISILQRSITDSDTEIEKIKIYPNPVNIGLGEKITFSELPINPYITIYTSAGDPVITLQPADADFAGRFVWDGYNSSGSLVASGIYLYSVTGGDSNITGSFVIK